MIFNVFWSKYVFIQSPLPKYRVFSYPGFDLIVMRIITKITSFSMFNTLTAMKHSKASNINYYQQLEYFKEAPKSQFTHYSYVVVNLFNTGFYKSAFSTYSFGKLVLMCFCIFCAFCLVFVLNLMLFCKFIPYIQHICVRCYVILFSLYNNYL